MTDPSLMASFKAMLAYANDNLPHPLPEPYLSFFSVWCEFNDMLLNYLAEQDVLSNTIHDMTLALAQACKDGEIFIKHDELDGLHDLAVERCINKDHDVMWRIAIDPPPITLAKETNV